MNTARCNDVIIVLFSLIVSLSITVSGQDTSNTSSTSTDASSSGVPPPSNHSHSGPLTTCYYCDNRTSSGCLKSPDHKSVCKDPHAGCFVERSIQEGNFQYNFIRAGCMCSHDLKCFDTNFEEDLKRHTCIRVDVALKRYDKYKRCITLKTCIKEVKSNKAKTKNGTDSGRTMTLDEDENSPSANLYNAENRIQITNKQPELRNNDKPYRMMVCYCKGNLCNSNEFWKGKYTIENHQWFQEGLALKSMACRMHPSISFGIGTCLPFCVIFYHFILNSKAKLFIFL